MIPENRYYYLIIALFFLTTGTLLGQSRKEVLALLKKYDSDGLYVITSYENAPRKYIINNRRISLGKPINFMIYVDSVNTDDLWDEMNTVVHEMCHAYSGTMAFPILEKNNIYDDKIDYYALYRGNKNTLLLPITNTFLTKKITNAIPTKLRTLRFTTYIDTEERLLGAQQHGVYGLLEEWNAYYHGTKTSFLSYDYYKNKNNNSPTDLLEYMQSVDGTFFAHAEFKFYILEYLLYARNNYPIIFKNILSNTAFKKAYKEINADFTNLIMNYQEKRSVILSELKNEGHNVELTDKWTKIGNSGIGNYMDSYKLLMNELSSNTYQKLEKQILN